MTIRTDLTIDWYSSPRLITVAAPSTEITVQDLYDTLSDAADKMDTMTFPRLIEAAGKEPLGGGVSVGVTATLQNAQVAFEARPGPTWELCIISGGNIVAVDDVGAELDTRYPTAYTTVDRAASSSATLLTSSGTLTPGDIDDIADAVWDEDLTTHTTSDSAGAFIQNMWKKIKAVFTEVV
jgi:hypothetical protein